MSLDGTISVQIQVNDRRSVGIVGQTAKNLPVSITTSFTIADGVGAGQANQIYQGTLALVAGALDVDLTGGTLKDLYGDALTAARVKFIYVKNNSVTNNLVIGNDTAAWATLYSATGTETLKPGGIMLAYAPDATGYAVTATTADILQFAGTGTDTFDLILLVGKT